MSTEIQERESYADPWSDFDRAFDAMQRRLAESFGILPFGPFETEPGLRAPRMDVTDAGTAYKVVAEIPGIPKEKLDIRVRGPVVEIRAEHEANTEEKQERFLRRERTYAGYYRALELPEPVVATEAKANVVNGLLELELPKQHPTPSEAEVKVSVN
ncbi:MAG TPA: Hsp20/alpha crystallin family protein [Thermoplasmata archaeon]|nr:Hsp20/alpha crystallin family protein [Thermoplasmata archaeon]